MENSAEQGQNQEVHDQEPRDIIVPAGSVNTALRVALEHGSIDVATLRDNDEVHLSKKQAKALIEELQSQGLVSREASEDGSFEKVTTAERLEREKTVAPKVKSIAATRFSRMLSTPARQVGEFVKYNDAVVIAKTAGSGARSLAQTEGRTAKREKKERDAETARQNAAQAANVQALRESRAKEEAWQKARKWRIQYEPTATDAQAAAPTPTPEATGDADLMKNVIDGGSLFGGPAPSELTGTSGINLDNINPRDVPMLLKNKVINRDEAITVLSRPTPARRESGTSEKEFTPESGASLDAIKSLTSDITSKLDAEVPRYRDEDASDYEKTTSGSGKTVLTPEAFARVTDPIIEASLAMFIKNTLRIDETSDDYLDTLDKVRSDYIRYRQKISK